jgi:mersacidin/lichenicidin family type 2 lantibiotic
MTPDQIVRAWKDADYSAALGDAATLPPNPVGVIEVTDAELGLAAGGSPVNVDGTQYLETLGCCKGITQSGYCDVTAGFPYCTCFCITIVLTGASLC